jgi:hypothetical protein
VRGAGAEELGEREGGGEADLEEVRVRASRASNGRVAASCGLSRRRPRAGATDQLRGQCQAE